MLIWYFSFVDSLVCVCIGSARWIVGQTFHESHNCVCVAAAAAAAATPAKYRKESMCEYRLGHFTTLAVREVQNLNRVSNLLSVKRHYGTNDMQ